MTTITSVREAFLAFQARNQTHVPEPVDPPPEPKPTRGRRAKPQHPDLPRRSTPMKWSLTRITDNVTVSDQRMVAWYLLDPQRWSFRTTADGEALIEQFASTLAELVGHTIHGRITSRPYPVAAWAEAAWTNSPAPTAGFAKILERGQTQLARRMQSDKLVYLGIDLGPRSRAVGLTGKVVPDVARREFAALQQRLGDLDDLMEGPGVAAQPAFGNDMAWLLARSFALGCPVPEPDADSVTDG